MMTQHTRPNRSMVARRSAGTGPSLTKRRELLFGLPDDIVTSLHGVVRTMVLVPFRISLNLLARRRPAAHLLYALTPNEATHLEHPVISVDRKWEAVAVEVAQWAEERGLAVPDIRSGSR